jgi:hypothetical protein
MEGLYTEATADYYRHNLFIARSYTVKEVIKIAKRWNVPFFMCAEQGDDTIGYVEWGYSLKTSTIRNKGPFEWYAKAGTSEEIYDVLSGMDEFYEEGVMTKKGRKVSVRSGSPVRSQSSSDEIIQVIKDELPKMCMVNELESENEALKAKIKELESDKDDRVVKLEKALKESKADLVSQVERIEKAHEEEIDEYKQQVKAHSGLIQKFKKDNLKLVNELDDAKALFEGYDKLKQELREAKEEITRHKAIVKKRVEEYSEIVRQRIEEQCEGPLRQLQDEKEYLSQVIGEQEEEIKALKAQLAQMTQPRLRKSPDRQVSPPRKRTGVIDIFDMGQEASDGQVGIYRGEGILNGEYLCYQSLVGWLPCEEKEPKRGPWYSKEGKMNKDSKGKWVLDE